MPSERELFSNLWLRGSIDDANRLVRVQRTAERLSLEGLATMAPLAALHIPLSRRPTLRLLLDARLAPLLASAEVERQLGPSTQQLFEGFSRCAVLIATAVGRLQATRFSRQNGSEAPIFDNESAALAFLLV